MMNAPELLEQVRVALAAGSRKEGEGNRRSRVV
jgi:hypothetical protein